MQYYGENGILKKAKEKKSSYGESVKLREEETNQAIEEYKKMVNAEPIPEVPEAPEIPKGPNGKPLVNKDTVGTTNHEKIVGEDTLGNQVVVPKGFKVLNQVGATVKEGFIIEDEIGNQFVWIPVSNINADGTGKIKVDSISEEGVEITLGRYTFIATSPGTETIVQKGSEYNQTVNESNNNVNYKITASYNSSYYHYEFSQSRLTNYKNDTTGINTTAKDLKGFIESVRDNHGYYIARYEASFGSGVATPDASKINTAEYITNQKPLSKQSTKHTRASGTEQLEEGMLWNCINQGDAAKVCRNMYSGESYGVESDLLNSYMWDTAIVYIQKMGNTNYANATRGSNTTIKDTGTTDDIKCNIYDMAANIYEWTTEYCTCMYSNITLPNTFRGGSVIYEGVCTAHRHYDIEVPPISIYVGFRPGLYIK